MATAPRQVQNIWLRTVSLGWGSGGPMERGFYFPFSAPLSDNYLLIVRCKCAWKWDAHHWTVAARNGKKVIWKIFQKYLDILCTKWYIISIAIVKHKMLYNCYGNLHRKEFYMNQTIAFTTYPSLQSKFKKVCELRCTTMTQQLETLIRDYLKGNIGTLDTLRSFLFSAKDPSIQEIKNQKMSIKIDWRMICQNQELDLLASLPY